MIQLIPLAMQLAQFVPGIVQLLAGDKAGEVAGKVVDVARTVSGIDDAKFAVQAIQTDPSKMMEFQLAMAERQSAFEQMYLADTQSARARDIELAKVGVKNHRANVLAGCALLLVVVCLFIVVWSSGADDFAKATISLILGRALGWVEQLFSFEFGTTRANKTKDDTINKLSGS